MLDQTAKTYIHARLRAYDILRRMEEVADNSFGQRLLFYGDLSYERENIEFYLLLARSIDVGNMMDRLSDELERRKTLSVWRTRLQDEEMNILEEFQRHLMPETKKQHHHQHQQQQQQQHQHQQQQKRSRYRQRRLPDGRIPVLDVLVGEYMSARAAATYSYRQATALVNMMSEGLPKRWAEKYLIVQQTLETKGLDHLEVLHDKWSKEAEILEEKHLPGQYSYGGEGDPDGRMLILEPFESGIEWEEYLKKRKEEREETTQYGNDNGSGSNSGSYSGSGSDSGSESESESESDNNSNNKGRNRDKTKTRAHTAADAPLPTRKPRPEVEIAQDLKEMWYDWWWERRILLFSFFGGMSGGVIVVISRWFTNSKISTTKRISSRRKQKVKKMSNNQ